MGMASSVVGLKLMIITCLVLVCMVASAPKAAAKALDFSSCVSIKTFIFPYCFDYFIEGGSVDQLCCTQAKELYNCSSIRCRRAVYACIEEIINELKWLPNYENNVRQLPKKCNI
jgi:hypothetical protein